MRKVFCVLNVLFLVCSVGAVASDGKDVKTEGLETIVFGAGCFWCVEAVFDRLDGVVKAESGYAGGHVANPTYKQVVRGNTGHAEVIRVTFKPDQITVTTISTASAIA